jgi:hypothetical protein
MSGFDQRDMMAHVQVHRDFIIEHSPMQGGWCVYEQVAYAEYDVVAGPFPYQDQAETALEELTSEQ